MRDERHSISPVTILGMALAIAFTIAFVVIACRSMPRHQGHSRTVRPDAGTTTRAPPAGVHVELTAGDVEIERTLPRLAFRLEPGETLDARLAPGPFTAVFEVAFHPGRVAQAAVGAQLLGGQLIVRRGDDILLSAYAGDEPQEVWPTVDVPPLRFGGGTATLTFEFTATGAGPHALRPLWQPVDSLVSFPLPSAGAPLLADAAMRGFALVRSSNCVACHGSADLAREDTLARHPGPILGDAGARLRPEWIRRRLLDPGSEAPHRMPAMGPAIGASHAPPHRAAWAEDLTHFLVSMGGPLAPDTAPPDAALVATGRIAYHTVGCFACHGPLEPIEALPPGHGAGTGAGEPLRTYTPLAGLAGRTTVDRLAAYLEDPLRTHARGLMPDMSLSRVEAAAIASYLISRESPPAPGPAFTVDAARVDPGRASFVASGCANCHELGPDRTPIASTLRAPALEALVLAPESGCLAPDPPAHVPDYGFDAAARADIAAWLAKLPARRSEHVPLDDLAVSLETLDCLACHSYESSLGPESAVAAYFAVDGEADLGDQGRLPPTLNDAGGRLTESWMRDVLAGSERARPYLGARMPRFGESVVGHLPALLTRAAGATKRLDHEPAFSIEGSRDGRALVGDSGLNCIQCHAIAGHEGTGTPGPDLALMPGRVRYDWFARWLHDPSRVRPGTRMPTFFVGGVGSVTEVLGGDATRQIEAIWSYLSQGDALALPDGLVDPAGLELVVGTEPIVFRTFMADAGVRAIACGFPEQIHCAFDADRCMVTAVWQGRFLSASGAWGARGGNETNPEETVWTAPDGPFVEIVGTVPATRRFRGYDLDAARRPVFRYDVVAGGVVVKVREQPAPRLSGDRARLVRTFTMEGPPRTRVSVPATVVTLTAGVAVASDGERAVLELDDQGRLAFEVEVTW